MKFDVRASLALSSAVAAAIASSSMHASAFVLSSRRARSPTALHLEDHIADMIDGEVRRLDRKRLSEAESLLEQRRWTGMEPSIPAGFDFEEDLDRPLASGDPAGPVLGFSSGVDRSAPSASSPRRRKDERMAADDPMRYCADRCVTTGNCDVFEDMFKMGPGEVMKFCEECVLSEGEEPCDVPESLYGDDEGLAPSPPAGLHP